MWNEKIYGSWCPEYREGETNMALQAITHLFIVTEYLGKLTSLINRTSQN